jgi:hypothetical protein
LRRFFAYFRSIFSPKPLKKANFALFFHNKMHIFTYKKKTADEGVEERVIAKAEKQKRGYLMWTSCVAVARGVAVAGWQWDRWKEEGEAVRMVVEWQWQWQYRARYRLIAEWLWQ